MSRRISLFSLFLFSFFSCSKGSNSNLLKRVENEIRINIYNKDYIYNLSEMTDFDWDVLYTIPPYSNDDSIRNITGIQDLKNIQTSISNSDSISLFLFVKDDKIVEYLELSRTVADFASSRKVQRNRSRFTLKTKDGWTSAVWVE